MKIGVIQLTSKLDYQENLYQIEEYLALAVQKNASAVFLPEAFFSYSNGLEITPYVIEEKNGSGNIYWNVLYSLLQKYPIAVLGGSVVARNERQQLVNRAYNFSPQHQLLGIYDKMHLFSYLPKESGAVQYQEAKRYHAGSSMCSFLHDGWNVGITICFDLRFPELFRYYATRGVELISVSSAFTVPTGKAHWHTLLRARAIENQCYIVAAAQCGTHNERLATYGHSLVVDPWGEIIEEMDDRPGLKIVEVHKEKIKETRNKINSLYIHPSLRFFD